MTRYGMHLVLYFNGLDALKNVVHRGMSMSSIKFSPANLLVIAALLGAMGVISGAFGAHALKSVMSAKLLQTYQTAVDYHTFYSVVLLCLGVLGVVLPRTRTWYIAASLFLIGVMLFSGSLYALSLSGVRAFGMLTPIGGLLLIAGWVSLGLHAYHIRSAINA